MSWFRHRKQVQQREIRAEVARSQLGLIQSEFKVRLGKILSTPEALIWSYSSGLIWELGRNESKANAGSFRSKVTRLARMSMLASRMAGFTV